MTFPQCVEPHAPLNTMAHALDGSPVRPYSSRQRKRVFKFPYVLVARVKLDQPEIGDVRDRGIDYCVVLHGSNRDQGRAAVNRVLASIETGR